MDLFDIDALPHMDKVLAGELEFISGLARSGLSDAQVSELLRPLKFPYRYPPWKMAYSFIFGWVCPEFDERNPEEVFDEWLEHLIGQEEADTLLMIRDRITGIVDELGLDDDEW